MVHGTTPSLQHSLRSDAHVAITTAAAVQLHARSLRGKLLAALIKMLQANRVQRLELGAKLHGASAYANLAQALSSNSSLQVLSFSGSHMGDAAVEVSSWYEWVLSPLRQPMFDAWRNVH